VSAMPNALLNASSMLSIGAVSKRTGVSVSALRYYESEGLIPEPRRVSRRRVYDDGVFSAIALVQLAQNAGFTVAETRMLIAGFERATPASARWQAMAHRKLADIARRIEEAERMRRLLECLLQCRCETLEDCVQSRAEALRSAQLSGASLGEGSSSHEGTRRSLHNGRSRGRSRHRVDE
jgi:MerR family transcriptional regulator, redox-sensitive transcriptional activator SoxR